MLFEQTSIDGSYECSNCISGQINEIEYCNCHKYPEGECHFTNDNFLNAVAANTELECFIRCSSKDGCLFYTWYRSVNFYRLHIYIVDRIVAKFHQINHKQANIFVG